MSLHLGELLLELAIEYTISAALTAAVRSAGAGRAASVQTLPRDHAALSALPGRVRLPVAGLRGDPACAAALTAALGDWPGITRVSASALTGNALILYDPARLTVPQIRAAIAAA